MKPFMGANIRWNRFSDGSGLEVGVDPMRVHEGPGRAEPEAADRCDKRKRARETVRRRSH